MPTDTDAASASVHALTCRGFLQKSGAAVVAANLVVALSLPMSALGSIRPTVFVGPPCGLDCDKLEFDKPGKCPACGMKLP